MILNKNYSAETVDAAEIQNMLDALDMSFVISPLLILPLVFIIFMVIFKIPAIPGLMLSVFMGVFCAIFVQGHNISSVGYVLQYGYVSETGNAMVDELLQPRRSSVYDVDIITDFVFFEFWWGYERDRHAGNHRKEHLEICKKRWFSDFLYHLHLRFYEPCIW